MLTIDFHVHIDDSESVKVNGIRVKMGRAEILANMKEAGIAVFTSMETSSANPHFSISVLSNLRKNRQKEFVIKKKEDEETSMYDFPYEFVELLREDRGSFVKLRVSGKSGCCTISKRWVYKLGWKIGDCIKLKRMGRKIILERAEIESP